MYTHTHICHKGLHCVYIHSGCTYNVYVFIRIVLCNRDSKYKKFVCDAYLSAFATHETRFLKLFIS